MVKLIECYLAAFGYCYNNSVGARLLRHKNWWLLQVHLQAIVKYSCLEQAQFGQCNEPFMTETQAEMPEGTVPE